MSRKMVVKPGIPPNFDLLDPESQAIILEEVYRREFKASHGWPFGSPCLKSSGKIVSEVRRLKNGSQNYKK